MVFVFRLFVYFIYLFIYFFNLGELTLYCLRVPNICSLYHSEADFFSLYIFFTCFALESKQHPLKFVNICLLKAALIDIWPLGGSRLSCQHNTDILLHYRFIMAEKLADSYLRIHWADKEHHDHSFEVVLVLTWLIKSNVHASFNSVLVVDTSLKTSVSSASKGHIMFTS